MDRFGVNLASKRLRERRILVFATDFLGAVYHVIFNIQKTVYLEDITSDILNYLQYSKNMRVIAMVTLDTGYYDILKILNLPVL